MEIKKKEIFDKRVGLEEKRTIARVIRLFKASYSIKQFKSKLLPMGHLIAGEGSFKESFIIGKLVVKTTVTNRINKGCASEEVTEIKREVEQYKYAPPGFRKHLPRLFVCINDFVMIQERVLIRSLDGKDADLFITRVDKLAEKYDLYDYIHNYGIGLDGRVKFFDWVWRRDDNHDYNPDLPLKKNYQGP